MRVLSTDQQLKSLPTATSELHALLAIPDLGGVPLLVLANKNDLPGSLPVDDIINRMRLSEIQGRAVSVSQSLQMSRGRRRSGRAATSLEIGSLQAVLFDKQQDKAQSRHRPGLAHAESAVNSQRFL